MRDALETQQVGDLTVELHLDEGGDHECPLDMDGEEWFVWANFERNYKEHHEYADPEEALADAKENGYLIFNLYRYEHGFVAYKIGELNPFSCPWDSCQVGYVFVDKSKARDTWMWKRISAKRLAYIEQQVRHMAEIYSAWVNGEIYGFVVEDSDGEHIDSCWGFYERDYCLQEGVSVAEQLVKKGREQELAEAKAAREYRAHRIKAFITNHVYPWASARTCWRQSEGNGHHENLG